MSENKKRDRGTVPLSPETAEPRVLQPAEYQEGGDDRAPSFMTNETGEAETNIAASLALFGMDADIRTFSPLALAFLGDAVYSLIIRTSVIAKGNRQAEKLHNETTRLVRILIPCTTPRVPRWKNICRQPLWKPSAVTSTCRAERSASWNFCAPGLR